VERFDADVCSVQAALQQAPEIFHRVCVNIAVHVLNGVIDDGVLVVGLQPVIRFQFVREDGRASFHMLTNVLLNSLLFAVVHNHHPHVSAAFHHAHDDSLVFAAGPCDLFGAFGLVHGPRFAADERLVNFDRSAQFCKRSALHGQTDSMKHKPSRLLRHFQIAREFVAADAVLAIANQPSCREPLFQAERGILKDRADLQGKLGFRVFAVALPAAHILEICNLLRTAVRAVYLSIGPSNCDHELVAVLGIGKEGDRLLQRCGPSVHESIIRQNRWLVKYVITQTSIAWAIIAIALPAIGSGQSAAPTWIRFTASSVKPDMVQEYEGYVKQMAAAYKKAGQPVYAVLSNFSGNRFEYTTVTFVMKFGDMDGPNPIQKALGEEAYANLIRSMNRCVVSSTRYYSLPSDDVTIDKSGQMGQYFMRTRVPIAPGKNAEYRAYLKNELKPVYEKGGVTWFRVSAPVFGGPAGTVETVRMMKNLGEIDGGPFATKLLGADGARALAAKAQGLTRGPSQITIMRMRPELSLLPAPVATR